MADAAGGQGLADPGGQVALHDLGVIEIELDLEVGCTDGLHDAVRLGLMVEEIAGHVARIDRLDQHLAPLGRRLRCGPGQVGLVDLEQCGTRQVGRGDAGHHMDARAVQRPGIGQRGGQAGAELGLAAGQTGQAALAGLPVARGRVEQHLLQAVGLQPRGDLLGREGVGEQKFDTLEAVRRGGGEAVEKVVLVVEHGEIGGEAGHGEAPESTRVQLSAATAGAARAPSRAASA